MSSSATTSSFSDDDLDNLVLSDEDWEGSAYPILESSWVTVMDKNPLAWDVQLDTPDDDSRKRKYDVFLSFRGEDTRTSFISHLSASLQNAGIIAFKDDQSLPRGHSISKSLLQAIEDSNISVIVFSKNYADSTWCLQELSKIMECRRTIGQMVMPVFYNVHPSEVRHQTGDFGKAFLNLLLEEELTELRLGIDAGNKDIWWKWKNTLHDAAGLAGFAVLNSREQKLLRD